MNNNMQQLPAKGFSLIELMVVVTIIAILSAVAVPVYQNYVARAHAAEILAKYDAVRTYAISNAYAMDLCSLPPSLPAGYTKDMEAQLKSDYMNPNSEPEEPVRLAHQGADGNPIAGTALRMHVDVNVFDHGKMAYATARELYLVLQKVGMLDEDHSVLGNLYVDLYAYLGNGNCATGTKVASVSDPAAGQQSPAQPAQPQAQPAQQPPQSSGPPPKPPAEEFMAHTCSGRLCPFVEEETPCEPELVQYDGATADGNDQVRPAGPNTPPDRLKWVAFAITTITDDANYQRSLTKRCATYDEAKSLWWDQTSDNNGGCMSIYDEQLAPNGVAVTCHYGVALLPGEDERNLQKTSDTFPQLKETIPGSQDRLDPSQEKHMTPLLMFE